MRNQIKAIFIVASLWITNISFVHADAIKNIPYTFTANAEQTLDIYRPDIVSFARPVLVYVHGGAWVAGDKGLDGAQVKTYINQGVILVSLNYRLAPGAKFPDNIKDIYAASDWITSNIKDYGGDPNNMVMVGHSAGAHLAALAGVGTKGHPPLASQYKAIIPVDTAGFDLTHRNRSNLDGITHRAIIKTFGRRIKTLKAGSPLHQIEAGEAIILLFYLYQESVKMLLWKQAALMIN